MFFIKSIKILKSNWCFTLRSEPEGGTPQFASSLRNIHQTQARELFSLANQSWKADAFKMKNRKMVNKKPKCEKHKHNERGAGRPRCKQGRDTWKKSAFLCDRAPRCITGRPMYDLDNKTEGFCNKANQKKTGEKVKMLETQGNMPKWPKLTIFTSRNECYQGYNNKRARLAGHRFARGLLQVKTENINFVK